MAPRILLADTFDCDLVDLTDALRGAGYIVSLLPAEDCVVASFDAQSWDAIVLHLGRGGAAEGCQALRAHALGATVPVVFVAGDSAQIDCPAAALAAGADALWRLPIDAPAALKRLSSWVGPPRPHISIVAASQALEGSTPAANDSAGPRLRRMFTRAPKAAPAGRAQASQSPQEAIGMAPPPHLRRSPPPAWPPRGMGGGVAVAVDAPQMCAPWSDPDALAREHIRASCALMQRVDYYTMAKLPLDAPYLVVDRALQGLQTAFLPEQFSLGLRHEAKRELKFIAQMLEEARFVLADADRRAAYTQHMRRSEPKARAT